jgi:acetyl-CoA synthetase
MEEGRDAWWEEIVPRQSADCLPEEMDSEDLLYRAGTTARPKGIMLTVAGQLGRSDCVGVLVC